MLSEDSSDFALDLLVIPRRNGQEALPGEDLVLTDTVVVGLAKGQGHGFRALALLSQEEAVEVDERLGPGFFAYEAGSKALVQVDQVARGGAQFVRGHGGILPKEEEASRTGQCGNRPKTMDSLQLKPAFASRSEVLL